MLTESQIQSQLVAWFRLAHRGLGVPDTRLLIMVPNGAYFGGGQTSRGGVPLSVIRFAKLKREGFVQGVPDLFLAVPRRNYAGLWLELKREKGGTVSPVQHEMHALLALAGYRVEVAKGFENAVATITRYLHP